MEENRETILDELTSFEKKNPKEITPILEDYLLRIAKTGDTMFPWNKLKPLFLHKMEKVISEFYETCPSEDLSSCPNVEKFCFESMKEKLLEAIDNFSSAPFTIQRLCELITTPRKHYKRTDKFLRGLEKNVLVVSTVEPGCSHIFACDCSSKRRERDSVPLVNGIVDPPASVNGMSDFTSFSGKGSLNASADFISIFPESGHEDSKPYTDIEKDNPVDADKDVNMDTSSSMVVEESDSSNHQPSLSESTHFQETAEVKQEAAATSSINEDDSVSSSLSNDGHQDNVDSIDITDSQQINRENMSSADSQQSNPDSNTASQSNELILLDNKEIEEPSEEASAAVVSSKEESPPDSSTETEKMEEKEIEVGQDDVCDTTPSEKEERAPMDSNVEIKDDNDTVSSPCSNEITTTSSPQEEEEKLDSSSTEQNDKIPDSSEAEECNISKTTDDKVDIEPNVEMPAADNDTTSETKENTVEPMDED